MASSGDFLKRSRHSTTFYFRRRVPLDLVAALGINYLCRTLRTCHRPEAVRLARQLACATDEWFKTSRDKMAKGTLKPLDEADFGLIMTIDLGGGRKAELRTEPHDSPEVVELGIKAMQHEVERSAASLPPVLNDKAAPSALPTITLRELTNEFLATRKSSRTVRAYRTAFEHHFLPHFGADSDISVVDQDGFARWVITLFADVDRSHSSKVGYVNAVTSMFGWRAATHSATTPVLSAKRLIPENDRADTDERDGFEMDELGRLFVHLAQYRQTRPAKFWAPIAVAFMGCRLEELAQVNLETDLQKSDQGVWFISINDDADLDGVKRKAVKKKSSRRPAPLHSALVRHGFLDYLLAEKAAGMSRPFERQWTPWIEPDRQEPLYGHAVTKWGGRELKKLAAAGVIQRGSRNLTFFHSMRHTLTTHLAENEVQAELRAALLGQVVPGAGENARYTKLKRVSVLSALVEKHLDAYSAMLDSAMVGSAMLPVDPTKSPGRRPDGETKTA